MSNDVVIGYARKSVEKKVDGPDGEKVEVGVSVENQTAAIESYAARRWPGAEVIVFSDNRVSGAVHPSKRPGMGALLERLASGPRPVGLVVTEQSRLTRGSTSDLDVLLDAALLAGLEQVDCSDGGAIRTDDLDRFEPHLMQLVHQKYRNDARRRARNTHRTMAEQGRYVGRAPFGYATVTGDDHRPALVVVPEEKAVVLRAYELVESGLSLNATAAAMNAEGLRRRDGSPWRHEAVSNLVRLAAYAGLRRYGASSAPGRDRYEGTDLFKAKWEEIVTPERWRRLMELAPPKPRRGRRPKAWLSSSILRCGRCGGLLRTHTKGRLACASANDEGGVERDTGKRAGVRCSLGIDGDLVDEAVRRVLCARLASDGDLAARLTAGDDGAQRLRDDLATIDARLAELGRSFGTADPTFLQSALASLTDEKRRIVDALTRRIGLPDGVEPEALADPDRFAALPVAVKRMVASALVESITLTPATVSTSTARRAGPFGSPEYREAMVAIAAGRLTFHWRDAA